MKTLHCKHIRISLLKKIMTHFFSNNCVYFCETVLLICGADQDKNSRFLIDVWNGTSQQSKYFIDIESDLSMKKKLFGFNSSIIIKHVCCVYMIKWWVCILQLICSGFQFQCFTVLIFFKLFLFSFQTRSDNLCLRFLLTMQTIVVLSMYLVTVI